MKHAALGVLAALARHEGVSEGSMLALERALDALLERGVMLP